jgi:octaprenyl-diphosphate synthase
VDETIYFEIIRKKTASLIASCCASGAASVGSDEATIRKMKDFGEKVGIAFQIKDDLFDYESSNKTGKPNGIDIKEQKMTLPLIYLLNKSGRAEKRKVVNIVKNHNTNPEKVRQVIDMVNQGGGIEYARKKMMEYHDDALAILDTFPESPSRNSLANLVNYTIERRK